MSKSPGRAALVRRTQIELVEQRRLMTADSPLDFHLDYSIEQQPIHGSDITTFGSPAPATTSTVAAAIGLTGAGQTVAVIDSGIAYDHPALGGGLGTNYRVVGGWDFAENDANPYDDGPAGSHGTHVAGIIGSMDSRSPGVATGVDLVSLRVFDDQGNGSFAWVEQALQWVHTHRNDFRNPITTVNLSIGSTWNSTNVPNWSTLEDEFAQLKVDGIFISVAAGNSFTTYNAPGLSYPAASSYVVPVASVDANGNLSSFSQRQDRVIAAPGQAIRSTVPDYVGNLNGRTDDFATFSGTSMAAPYVAGASVLIRQALQMAGTQNVNEDTIYGVMRQSADWVFDPATNHSYARLNLDRALTSIISTDDFGSTAADAFNLGTVTTTTKDGVIGTSGDRDYFSFVAGETGTARFTATTNGGWSANWDLVGGGGTVASGALSFSVVAGHMYTVGIASAQGTGAYTLSVNVEKLVTALGSVDFKLLSGQNLSAGDAWFSFTAARTGTLTAELLFSQAAGNVDLELYNSSQTLLASSSNATGPERVDVAATAGATFYVHVRGANSSVDLRLTNLVSVVGSTVTITGTSASDLFSLVAGATQQITINGVSYQFASSAVQNFVFAGGAGQDAATLTGTSGNDTATLRPGTATLAGANLQVSVSQTESITIYAGSGVDKAVLYDSAGNDSFTATPTWAIMVGSGYSNLVAGFDRVEARASQGYDQAILWDSPDNDTLLSTPTLTALYGDLFYNSAQNFDWIEARARAGGNDKAYFSDSAGDDTFIVAPTVASMFSSWYSNTALGFDRVQGQSSQGGHDKALFYDSSGDDAMSVRAKTAILQGSGYYNQADGFERVRAQSSNGTNTLQRAAIEFLFDALGSWS